MTLEDYLLLILGFSFGFLCCCVLTMGRRLRDEGDAFAELLADKQAAQDAARVKDLELQRVTWR